MADHVSFVSSMELAAPKMKLLGAPKDSKPPEFADNKEEGYVVAGSLVAFTENVDGQAKSDVLNGFLLAQLASDKKYEREVQTKQWYQMYSLVLGKIGFVLQSFEFVEYKESGGSFKMDAAVLEILEATVTGNEFIIIKKTLDALRDLKDSDNRVQIFSAHSQGKVAGNFQCGPCTKAKNGDVTVNIGAFYYKSNAKHGNFLFFHWDSGSTEMYRGIQSAVLNDDVMSTVRGAILKKLGDNAVNFVLNLEI